MVPGTAFVIPGHGMVSTVPGSVSAASGRISTVPGGVSAVARAIFYVYAKVSAVSGGVFAVSDPTLLVKNELLWSLNYSLAAVDDFTLSLEEYRLFLE